MNVFFDKFDRHDHGRGLKGQSTHYCPGCGHGLVHKFLADAIQALGIQDRTVVISPVGCAVFLYYYFDVGNTQAAHGRAPVVGLGHKLSNPDSVVVSYQGDGDLASIGLAEIMHTAQLGLPISVIFVNNAVYGMTGGQMAPTTLMGQKTTTSPLGRNRFMGEPLRMAELMATLDGPVYVERVALFDAKNRARAKKAILRGLKLQVENRGFSFVEVLAECPTHLHMDPASAERWVKEKMLPVFPLGVKKDEVPGPLPLPPAPSFLPDRLAQVVGGTVEAVPRYCAGFPKTPWGRDIAVKLAGSGGDGAQTAALLLAHAAINEGFDATHIPSYGPESRGGTSYADVHIAEEEVLSPAAPHPSILVAFNAPSLTKFGPEVPQGGVVVYDSSVIHDVPSLGTGVRAVGVPFATIASEIGARIVKNIVALGAVQEATGIFPRGTFLAAIRQALRDKAGLVAVNEQAFARGAEAAAGTP